MLTRKEIAEIKNVIVENYRPDKVILFGSYARDDFDETSDLDLMIISDNEDNLPRYKRGLKVRLLLSDFDISKDVLFYTHNEFDRWKDIECSFTNQVAREGRVLYER